MEPNVGSKFGKQTGLGIRRISFFYRSLEGGLDNHKCPRDLRLIKCLVSSYGKNSSVAPFSSGASQVYIYLYLKKKKKKENIEEGNKNTPSPPSSAASHALLPRERKKKKSV